MAVLSKYDLVVGDQRLERKAEQGARTKAYILTAIIVGSLITLAFFIFIPKQDPPYPESQNSVDVLLGNTDNAYGTEFGPVKAGEPGSSAPADATPVPDQSAPIETGVDPDAPAINQPDNTPPTKTRLPINPETSTTKTNKPAQKQAKINNSLLDDDEGNGDGGKNGLGGDLDHSGTPDGKNNGQAGRKNGNDPYKGKNTGDGRYRKVRNSPKYPISYDRPGKVVVDVSIDREGNVVDATPGAVGTTITDNHVYLEAQKAAKQYKFDPNPNGFYREYTQVTIIISVR